MDLLTSEREKYRKAWATKAYGTSPGRAIASDVLPWFAELNCASLTDYGCGDGQAMRFFEQRIPSVLGVDLMGSAMGADGLVWEAPLWDLPPDLPATDFAFSSDTLEHLPPEYVDRALAQIAAKTRAGGFFQISCVSDRTGQEINETLHLTVRPPEWWARMAALHFHVTRVEGDVQLWLVAK